jgi:hypothetical protein
MKLSFCSVIVAAVLVARSSNVAAERGVSLDAISDDVELMDDLPDACDWSYGNGPTWTHWKKDDKKV